MMGAHWGVNKAGIAKHARLPPDQAMLGLRQQSTALQTCMCRGSNRLQQSGPAPLHTRPSLQHAQVESLQPVSCPVAWHGLPSSPLLAHPEELLWWQLPEHGMCCQLLAQRHHRNSRGSEVQLLLAPLHQVTYGVHFHICQQACRAGNP